MAKVTPEIAEVRQRIGAEIKRLRLTRKLNQTELAQRVGVDQSTISDFEKGAAVPAERLFPLCAALVTTPEELVTQTACKTWPFASIDIARFNALDEIQRHLVEGRLLEIIETHEKSAASKKRLVLVEQSRLTAASKSSPAKRAKVRNRRA